MIKICLQCNKEFKTRKSVQKFCSWICVCSDKKENNKYAVRKEIKTSELGKQKQSISMINFYINNQKARDSQSNIALSKGFGKWMKNRKLSIETRLKMSENRKGEKHWNWKGGINKNDLIRKSMEYKLWRRSIFERDFFTCQECKITGGELNAHHIKPFSLFPELRFAIDNGVTLCKDCHKKTDTWGFKVLKYKEKVI